LYDKRQDIAKKDAQKQIAINLKNKQYWLFINKKVIYILNQSVLWRPPLIN
jgi:hypothetical protein